MIKRTITLIVPALCSFALLLSIPIACYGHVVSRYGRPQQKGPSIYDINKLFYSYKDNSASYDHANGARYSTPHPRNDAYSRHQDWVWSNSRHAWVLATPGARTPDKPNQRPFGPLGIGAQPQIFETQMPNGKKMLTDYYGYKWKAPRTLGMGP